MDIFDHGNSVEKKENMMCCTNVKKTAKSRSVHVFHQLHVQEED
jgi:hypothetical protein